MKVLNVWQVEYNWNFISSSGSSTYTVEKTSSKAILTNGDSLGDVIKAIDVQIKLDACGNKSMNKGLVSAIWLGTAISPED